MKRESILIGIGLMVWVHRNPLNRRGKRSGRRFALRRASGQGRDPTREHRSIARYGAREPERRVEIRLDSPWDVYDGLLAGRQ
jgi:hypothetical protein